MQADLTADPVELINALAILKPHLDKNNVSLYFKLLNQALPKMQSTHLMEQVIKEIGSVDIENAYSIKK